MRIAELVETIVTEEIARVMTIGNFKVAMLTHAVDQMRDRGVRMGEVDMMLKKMLKYAEDISQMDTREGFFVVHNHKRISLGISKMPDNKLTLITVINTNMPYSKGVDKIFYVN